MVYIFVQSVLKYIEFQQIPPLLEDSYDTVIEVLEHCRIETRFYKFILMISSFVIVIKLKKTVSCNRVIQEVNYLLCFY